MPKPAEKQQETCGGRTFALAGLLHQGRQDRDGLLGRQRGKCRKGSKGETESEGLTRVWRGNRSWKKASPERKKGWRKKKYEKSKE